MIRPDYLSGTFLEARSGFFLDGPLPPLKADDLRRNPWHLLGLALEKAKAGDFELLSGIPDVMREHTSMEFWDAASALLGHSAPRSVLRRVPEALGVGNPQGTAVDVLNYVAEIMARGGQLWSVPMLLPTILECMTRRGAASVEPIAFWLSELLEPNLGPVASPQPPANEYQESVLVAYARLVREYGSEGAVVHQGQLLDVCAMAENMRSRLADPDLDPESFTDRLWFEAATGVDCRAFFKGGELQPLAAAAIIEDFLDSGQADTYEPGVRYFFDHRIPD